MEQEIITAGCTRHNFMCAYTGTEPDRCPRCHSTWTAIAAPSDPPAYGGGDRGQHEAWHDRKDAARERELARTRARDAAGRR